MHSQAKPKLLILSEFEGRISEIYNHLKSNSLKRQKLDEEDVKYRQELVAAIKAKLALVKEMGETLEHELADLDPPTSAVLPLNVATSAVPMDESPAPAAAATACSPEERSEAGATAAGITPASLRSSGLHVPAAPVAANFAELEKQYRLATQHVHELMTLEEGASNNNFEDLKQALTSLMKVSEGFKALADSKPAKAKILGALSKYEKVADSLFDAAEYKPEGEAEPIFYQAIDLYKTTLAHYENAQYAAWYGDEADIAQKKLNLIFTILNCYQNIGKPELNLEAYCKEKSVPLLLAQMPESERANYQEWLSSILKEAGARDTNRPVLRSARASAAAAASTPSSAQDALQTHLAIPRGHRAYSKLPKMVQTHVKAVDIFYYSELSRDLAHKELPEALRYVQSYFGEPLRACSAKPALTVCVEAWSSFKWLEVFLDALVKDRTVNRVKTLILNNPPSSRPVHSQLLAKFLASFPQLNTLVFNGHFSDAYYQHLFEDYFPGLAKRGAFTFYHSGKLPKGLHELPNLAVVPLDKPVSAKRKIQDLEEPASPQASTARTVSQLAASSSAAAVSYSSASLPTRELRRPLHAAKASASQNSADLSIFRRWPFVAAAPQGSPTLPRSAAAWTPLVMLSPQQIQSQAETRTQSPSSSQAPPVPSFSLGGFAPRFSLSEDNPSPPSLPVASSGALPHLDFEFDETEETLQKSNSRLGY